jgi:hypothetical protein
MAMPNVNLKMPEKSLALVSSKPAYNTAAANIAGVKHKIVSISSISIST